MKSLVIYSLALLLQFYKLFQLKKSVQYYKKLINQLSSLQVLTIKQLKNKIVAGLLNIGDYVLCQGKLISGEGMRSVLDKNVKIVYSDLVVDKVFEIGDSTNTVKKHIRKMFSSFLKLTQPGQQVKIFQTLKTKFITTKFIKKTRSYKQKILNFGWLMSMFVKTPTRVISNVYIQQYIPQNAQMTILTKLPSTCKSSQLSFQSPIAIGSTKAQILLYFKDKLEYTRYITYAFYAIILATVYFIYRFHVKPLLLNNKNGRNVNRLEQITKTEKIMVNDRACSQCHMDLSNVIYRPCGHLQICQECYEKQAILDINHLPIAHAKQEAHRKNQINHIIPGQNKVIQCKQCEKAVKQIMIVYPC